jgi:hypothetical protein
MLEIVVSALVTLQPPAWPPAQPPLKVWHVSGMPPKPILPQHARKPVATLPLRRDSMLRGSL